jgi:hypothetical protein
VAKVTSVGFPLDHPYVEHCVLAHVGPTGFVLMRRLPSLWTEADPAVVPFDDFAASVGVGTYQLSKTLDRLVLFGYGRRPGPNQLHIFSRCAPLSHRLLERMPQTVRDAHARLLEAQARELAAGYRTDPGVDHITSRLDQLQRRAPTQELRR